MPRRSILVAILALAPVVPAQAVCCAGLGSCPAGAVEMSDCCEAAIDSTAAQRCCEEGASPEPSVVGAKADQVRVLATPPVVLPSGFKIESAESDRGKSISPLARGLHQQLYTLHSVLLI